MPVRLTRVGPHGTPTLALRAIADKLEHGGPIAQDAERLELKFIAAA